VKVLFCILCLAAGFASASGLNVVSSSTESVVIDLNASQPEYRNLDIRGESYSSVLMAGADNLAELSMPRVPVVRTWLEIPVGATVDVSITGETILSLDGPAWPIEPGIQSASKNHPRDSFIMELNPGVYTNGESFPSQWVRIVYAGEMRGRNLALVEVLPYRWNPSDNTAQLLSEATITLTFQGGDLAMSYDNANRYYAAPFEQMLSGMVENYGLFEEGTDTPPAPYLIIGHSDFVTTGMDEFVAWKESLGFDVTMVDLSVAGTTATAIRAYIQNAITTWSNPPVYVLLVGDTGYLPGGTATAYSGVTDLYYSCLDDGGFVPDVFLGRFSVTTVGQTVLMADRVMDYEQNVTGSTPWVQNTCWIASSDNYSISEGTHNFCIDTYFTPQGYTNDKVYPHSGGTAAQAITSINGGISMLTFSGHGSETSWGDMSFGQSDFNQLTNGTMLPGVFSHACLTGDYGTATCWGETWTRTPGRGGLWFFGSVPSTYWDQDDILERGEMDTFLASNVYWAKGMCNGGLNAVYAYYSGGGMTTYYFEGYTLFGDPSVQMAVWGETGIGDQGEGTQPGSTAIFAPNPVRSSAVVSLTGNGPAQLAVFDITGRVVATPYSGILSGTQSVNWDASSLTPGMYFLRLNQDGEVATARVMVIR